MRKILLVDDEDKVLALVEEIFGNDGTTEIRTAGDGEEALSIAREWQPHLAFLDIRMPKIDGFEVCKILKRDPATREIRVIMLTGVSNASQRQEAFEAGASDYITKPFSPVELLRKFEDILAQAS